MGENALVTVITPAFNVGRWISEAMDSVLTQRERRFHYVVVDDGSTDDTAAIAAAKAATDERVRVISTDNGGSAAARNIALAHATTPYVAFLDADDRWHPEFLGSQLAALSALPAEVGGVYCHSRVMLEGGQVVMYRWQPRGSTDLDRFLAENNPPHNGSSLLLRRSVFSELGGFDPALPSATDFEMWCRIAARSSTPLFWGTRRYLVDMRLMRTGSISSNRAARFDALDKVLVEYAPMMRRLHPGLAYVRPAVFAYRDGYDDIAERWACSACQAGSARLLRSSWGTALLAWRKAGPQGRAALRGARDRGRSQVYRSVASTLRLVTAAH